MTPEDVIRLIARELKRAKAKHPTWPEDQVHAAAIVAEEAGEAVQAALNHTYGDGGLDELRLELAQTAAMTIRALTNL